MKKIFLLMIITGSIACYAQENSKEAIYNTDDYIKIKSYYKSLVKSGSFNEVKILREQ